MTANNISYWVASIPPTTYPTLDAMDDDEIQITHGPEEGPTIGKQRCCGRRLSS